MIDFNRGVKLVPISEVNPSVSFCWRNSPEIWAWTRQNDLLNMGCHKKWHESVQFDPKIRMYGISAGPGAIDVVGVCGLTDLDMFNRRAEFSLYIGPEFQRSGYGKKALRTLLDHGFHNIGLNLIWGETFDGNHALKTFLDIGMRKDGTRQDFYWKNGRFLDSHMVSITSQQYYERWSPIL